MAKKPASAAAIAEGLYRALGTILHNGQSYAAGETVEDLTEAEAASLVAAGAIEAPAAPAENPAT